MNSKLNKLTGRGGPDRGQGRKPLSVSQQTCIKKDGQGTTRHPVNLIVRPLGVIGDRMEFVTNKQWYGLARRLENKNLRETGRSLTAACIARAANSFIADIQSDNGGMLVRIGWREAMRKQAAA